MRTMEVCMMDSALPQLLNEWFCLRRCLISVDMLFFHSTCRWAKGWAVCMSVNCKVGR